MAEDTEKFMVEERWMRPQIKYACRRQLPRRHGDGSDSIGRRSRGGKENATDGAVSGILFRTKKVARMHERTETQRTET